MRNIKALLLSFVLAIGTLPDTAYAQSNVGQARVVTSCSSQSYTAGQNAPVTVDTTGDLCGGGSGGGTQVVSGNVGGYEFNASVVPTVQNASYTAGQSLGGLQTISIGTTNSLAGILTQVQVISKGGSVTGIVVYVFSKNPTNSTFTDRTNVVVSQTDIAALIAPPLLITPALVLSAQDTATYGAATNLVGNFNNGSSNTNLYVALVTNATVTPASTTDLRIVIQGTKDTP